MIKQIVSLLIFYLFTTNNLLAELPSTGEKRQLRGKITDARTGETLTAATIYLPELKIGTLSDTNGNYSIGKLPPTRLTIQVSLIGYQSVSQTIELNKTSEANFELDESVTEISEVVITGQPGLIEQKRAPAPIAVVSAAALLESTSTNVIDALSRQPGISQITTGSGISKPVIRGLGYNRVIVVNDGIRQEGQQWGDEHGVEVDEYAVNHVEILKGPASLAFGSDALAGVINLLPAPTLPDGNIKGNLVTNYQTNNGLVGYSATLAGNNNALIWSARISGKRAHDYKNGVDGYVDNSRFSENAANLLAGINRSWGYSHVNLSYYELKPGIIGEGHHHGHEAEEGEDHEEEDHHRYSYQPEVPFQKITHYKAVWNNKLYLGKSNMEGIIGFQQNNRKEFDEADSYGLYFKLNTLNFDFKYRLPFENNWDLTTGTGGMWQQSQNKGSEFLVPAYRLFDVGIYAIARKRLAQFDVSGGLRVDRRHIDGEALFLTDAGLRFPAFTESFTGVSGSLGVSYQITESFYTKLNVSRGFRAPNIAELGSNGEHQGTSRYEIGNPELTPEKSLQFDWGLGIDSKHVSAELNLFQNRVDNYIYRHKLGAAAGGDSLINNNPAFKYTGGDARLYGGELFIDMHPHPWHFLHFQNTFSYTRGKLENQPAGMDNLPMIPPARWLSEIKLTAKKLNKRMENSWLNFGLEHNWKQEKIFSAYHTETATPAYTLLNAGLGTDITGRSGKLFSVHVSCNNLTNKSYQSHLSRLKYTGLNEKTGREGYYNMGRNISIKLIVPINVSRGEIGN
ncbi:MAG: TonB-dependent receptor [Mangrovibacterium sp.]